VPAIRLRLDHPGEAPEPPPWAAPGESYDETIARKLREIEQFGWPIDRVVNNRKVLDGGWHRLLRPSSPASVTKTCNTLPCGAGLRPDLGGTDGQLDSKRPRICKAYTGTREAGGRT
jgi:hypothetical protein